MIDTKIFTRFALTFAAAFALGAATLMTSCNDGGEEPTAPVISITTQPTAPAALTEGNITGSLTVEATATEDATLTYQWYTNTTASNEGGTAIDGATAASYPLPTTLTEGTYYYFCEISAEKAIAVRTNIVTVTVNAPQPVPVVTITTQPTAPAELTEGEIPADTKLTVAATVTEVGGATLTYQWYTDTTASNEGGYPIPKATEESYTLATTIPEGTYYYFCEVGAAGATAVRTNVVTVIVAALVPVLNSRITWKDGKYALTTDPTDGGLFFKFGGVVGLFTGNGALLTLPSAAKDGFDTGDIAWSPFIFEYPDDVFWNEIPAYDDYPANVDDAYHTAANVKAGKGDACRLVGLDLNKIATTDAASLTSADIDNGLWRLPTNAENQAFIGQEESNSAFDAHWTTLPDSGVIGGIFPDATSGSEATFLPAVGYRMWSSGAMSYAGSMAPYWSSMPSTATNANRLYFTGSGVFPMSTGNYGFGFAVRCVRQ